ncbi:hypothetical protein DFJ63DRAFT_301530 [Scheffersomyces coipomensis]|uniref:uncharacterized protein n=1 Tax=Scheffersomyces coipomensis TaxID=1788519 RepID=UPI00315D9D05
MTISSVAVIGAGPSGLIALDSLIREQKFDRIRLFERKAEAGGQWVFNKEPPEPLGNIKQLSQRVANKHDIIPSRIPSYTPKTNKHRYADTAIYSYLESNVEAKIMEFTEEVFPEGPTEKSIAKYGETSPFRHYGKVKDWIQDLYKRKGYDDHIEFKTSVELAQKDEKTGKWVLTLRKFGVKKDYVWHEEFDALLVASGKYTVPYVPNIDGLQEFHDTYWGSVIHSKQYRSKEFYRNKKVIVVGASVSAMDAIHDIIPVVKGKVISSIKKSTIFLPNFGESPFIHPQIERRTQIVKIDPSTKTVYFEDGSSEIGIDAFVFGTGYSFNFPFLPNLDLANNRIQHLYQHVLYIEDPTLAFVGCVGGGLTFKVFEWQAVFAARVFSGRAKLPPKEEQYKWEKDRIAFKGDVHKFVYINGEYEEYFNKLRELATNDGPGRKLPVYEPYWTDIFFRGHQRKMRNFIENNYKL